MWAGRINKLLCLVTIVFISISLYNFISIISANAKNLSVGSGSELDLYRLPNSYEYPHSVEIDGRTYARYLYLSDFSKYRIKISTFQDITDDIGIYDSQAGSGILVPEYFLVDGTRVLIRFYQDYLIEGYDFPVYTEIRSISLRDTCGNLYRLPE